jgi:K+-sensing histidine kinase KdpD
VKTFLAHLADKPSDTPLLRGVKRWLLMRQDLLRYGMAPLAVAIAFVARMALTPIVQGDSPYLFFIPAVLVAAGLGGLGPGLLATGLSAVLDLFVITDFRTLRFPKSSTPLHSS